MGRTRRHTRRRPRSNPQGTLEAHADGFGFVKTAEGEFYVPASKTSGAFDGDLVELAPLPARDTESPGGHPAARVVRVLARAHETLVGRYEVAEPFGVVVPQDPRIKHDVFTMRADAPDVPDGALVRVRMTAFPSRNTAATGVVEEVLGRADEPGASSELVIARHGLETAFSEAAQAQAQAAELDVPGALAEGYRDLRDRLVLTVDPDDARDFDDAVSIERADGRPIVPAGTTTGLRAVEGRSLEEARWRLGVHIADVSRLVPWGSSIDLDARRRATSVYLADRVVPMLPERLSDDLCSLRPGEDRPTMTADLYLDDRARLVAYELYPAVIRSDARLTYGQAQRLLDGNEAPGVDEALAARLSPRLEKLSWAARLRVEARAAAGGIDFDVPEPRVRLDADGAAAGIELRRTTPATSLIEQAMILANETVARHLRDAAFPCVYRVHERPAPDALAALVPVLSEYGWFSRVDRGRFLAGDAHAVAQVVRESRGRPEGELVSALVLRAMSRAVYRPTCDGHYGLASEAYAHFTSPIRRYPDLIVHRMLRAQMTKRPERFDQEVTALPWLAEHASRMERVAEAAARDSQEMRMAEYLQRLVGQRFSGVVSGVAPYGLYVRLENGAEGLLASRHLGGEYFSHDAARHRLTGELTGVSYRLGQRLRVVLAGADPRTGHVDLRLG